MISNEKNGGSNGPPPLPARPTSPSASAFGGFGGFAAASSSSLNVNSPGSPASTPGAGPSNSSAMLRLNRQHERLILELLPFKDDTQFREWITFLEGDWQEYCKDYLDPRYVYGSELPSDPEPDKTTTAQRAKDAINNRSPIFLAYHPDKSTWTPEDHAVRFVVTAISDSLLRKTWGERDWRKRPLEIAKAVYEVLSYRRDGDFRYRQQQWAMRQGQQQNTRPEQQQKLQQQTPTPAETAQLTAEQEEIAALERYSRQHQGFAEERTPVYRPHTDETMNDNPPPPGYSA